MDHLTMFFRFVVLVWRMRQKQKAYYRDGRKQSDLIASKELEKQIDQELTRLLSFDEQGQPAGLVLNVADDVANEPTQERLL